MFSRLFAEIRRRRVIETVAPYTVSAWLLIQIADILVPALTLPDWVYSLITVILLAGFPVALYLSWFFDFTDEGLKPTPPAADVAPKPLGPLHWLGLAGTLVAAISIGYITYGNVAANLAKQEEGIEELGVGQSIAVLPFQDRSPERNQAYLAEGIAEELTGLLGRMDGLKVAASGSSFKLAQQGMDPVAIARELDVATVLTGSVRNSGDRLKIRVELVNGADGKTLWTESFARTLADVFAIEDEIGRAIVNLLQDQYLEAGSALVSSRTASTDAYVLYLKGREKLRERTVESITEGRKLFEQVVGLDPEYAAGHVGVADSVMRLARTEDGFGTLDPAIAATVAETSLVRALARDPQSAEGFARMGQVRILRLNYSEAVEQLDQALALNPNLADAHLWRYVALKQISLTQSDRLPEAEQSLRTAYELDPASSVVLYHLGLEESRSAN